MVGVAGWTTGSSSGCGAVPSMKTSIGKITAADWMPDADWGVGLTATMKSVRTKPWATPRLRQFISRPTHTGPSQPPGKPCGPGAGNAPTKSNAPQPGVRIASRSKTLAVRPPAAVKVRTLQNSEREDGQCQPRLV